jgi:hypothetical protein
MTSAALRGLLSGIAEISALQRANPTPQQGGGFTRPEIVRAVGRAEVVLLSSHLERYLYALNEEAIDCILLQGPIAIRLPDEIRLLHARDVVDELARTQWKNRAAQLRKYSEIEANLWLDDEPVRHFEPPRLMTWMKAPTVDAMVRLFRMWGIGDIFASITRTPVARKRLRLRIGELVEKRNNIAHGDLRVEATYLDVAQYRSAAKTFCERADRKMARCVSRMAECALPW